MRSGTRAVAKREMGLSRASEHRIGDIALLIKVPAKSKRVRPDPRLCFRSSVTGWLIQSVKGFRLHRIAILAGRVIEHEIISGHITGRAPAS